MRDAIFLLVASGIDQAFGCFQIDARVLFRSFFRAPGVHSTLSFPHSFCEPGLARQHLKSV